MNTQNTILLILPKYLTCKFIWDDIYCTEALHQSTIASDIVGEKPKNLEVPLHWSPTHITTPLIYIVNAILLHNHYISNYWVCPCNSYSNEIYCLAKLNNFRLLSKFDRANWLKPRQCAGMAKGSPLRGPNLPNNQEVHR